jgi:hypothetical protein
LTVASFTPEIFSKVPDSSLAAYDMYFEGASGTAITHAERPFSKSGMGSLSAPDLPDGPEQVEDETNAAARKIKFMINSNPLFAD